MLAILFLTNIFGIVFITPAVSSFFREGDFFFVVFALIALPF